MKGEIMSFSKKLYGVVGALTAFAAATPVWAQDMVKNPTVEQMATMVNKEIGRAHV
jgi:hypothetical protein